MFALIYGFLSTYTCIYGSDFFCYTTDYMNKDKRGFTLIELLVVVAIIGILSGIVLAAMGNAKKSAFDAKVKAQLSNIRAAAEIYYDTNYTYGTASYSCSSGMFTDTASGLSRLSVSANYPVSENTIICNSTPIAYAVSDNLSTQVSIGVLIATELQKPRVYP